MVVAGIEDMDWRSGWLTRDLEPNGDAAEHSARGLVGDNEPRIDEIERSRRGKPVVDTGGHAHVVRVSRSDIDGERLEGGLFELHRSEFEALKQRVTLVELDRD